MQLPASRHMGAGAVGALGSTASTTTRLCAGPSIGWRWPFIIVAAPAVVCAFLMLFTVKEPPRGASEDALQVCSGTAESPGFPHCYATFSLLLVLVDLSTGCSAAWQAL